MILWERDFGRKETRGPTAGERQMCHADRTYGGVVLLRKSEWGNGREGGKEERERHTEREQERASS